MYTAPDCGFEFEDTRMLKAPISAAAAAWLIAGTIAGTAAVGGAAATTPKDSAPWTEGQHYFLIVPAQPTAVPKGKVEVMEVFSYGCPACDHFVPVMRRLKQSLPANAVVNFMPAGFNADEDWPMFQRAYVTAQMLGIADTAHEAMFDAVWRTGEMAIVDKSTGQLKAHLPTIEDAAQFYSRATGVSVTDFVAAAKSMGAETRIGQADGMLMRYRVSATPTVIINGKYRLDVPSAGGPDELIELVKWLVAKESH
jgi:thiol:disulfide interchange protein DsbA